MFTGLIEEVGIVSMKQVNAEGVLFHIFSTQIIDDLKVNDSVSINGVCLTVTNIYQDVFTVQAVHMTLEKSSLKLLSLSDKVNLERALRLNDRMGGHFVQGHVNSTGVFTRLENKGNNYLLWIKIPSSQFKYIVEEGSIALDGVSLTVARIDGDEIVCSIIPHTWSKTNLSHKKIGDLINVEVDMLAKYVENILLFKRERL